MTPGQWQPVDARKLSEAVPQDVLVRGVTVTVQISPYDVPTAFRGFYVPEKGVFRIEFRYIDSEPPEAPEPIDDCVSVILGRHSRKLLAIEVGVDRHRIGLVGLILEAVERADRSVKHLRDRAAVRSSARLNYGAINTVLSDTRTSEVLQSAT